LGLGAILLGSIIAFLLPRPEPPEVRLYTLEDSYRIGETVVIRLENVGGVSLCTGSIWPWEISRRVGAEWQVVDIYGHLPAVGVIEPGEDLEFGWVAQSFEGSSLVEVLPGEYRVSFPAWFCESASFARVDPGSAELFAFFELVA
jgi:hypothetical protein